MQDSLSVQLEHVLRSNRTAGKRLTDQIRHLERNTEERGCASIDIKDSVVPSSSTGIDSLVFEDRRSRVSVDRDLLEVTSCEGRA